MNQTALNVIRFENRNGTTSWRVTGWLHGIRIRKNFKTREEAAAEKATLEIKVLQAASGIFSYSRAQAIADGVLVNLTQFPVVRAYWARSLCCTDTVWAIIEEATKSGSDLDGVLHDICWVAKTTISQGNREADTVEQAGEP